MIVFKMPFQTKHFNKNQKVKLVSMTGDMACLARGQFRGNGSYIEAWVYWGKKNRETPKFIEVNKEST